MTSSPGNRDRVLIDYIRDHDLATKKILLPQTHLPMVHYYFPHAILLGYTEETPPVQEIPSADAVFDPGQSQPRTK